MIVVKLVHSGAEENYTSRGTKKDVHEKQLFFFFWLRRGGKKKTYQSEEKKEKEKTD
jgi:hypothetical protein